MRATRNFKKTLNIQYNICVYGYIRLRINLITC